MNYSAERSQPVNAEWPSFRQLRTALIYVFTNLEAFFPAGEGEDH